MPPWSSPDFVLETRGLHPRVVPLMHLHDRAIVHERDKTHFPDGLGQPRQKHERLNRLTPLGSSTKGGLQSSGALLGALATLGAEA